MIKWWTIFMGQDYQLHNACYTYWRHYDVCMYVSGCVCVWQLSWCASV